LNQFIYNSSKAGRKITKNTVKTRLLTQNQIDQILL